MGNTAKLDAVVGYRTVANSEASIACQVQKLPRATTQQRSAFLMFTQVDFTAYSSVRQLYIHSAAKPNRIMRNADHHSAFYQRRHLGGGGLGVYGPQGFLIPIFPL